MLKVFACILSRIQTELARMFHSDNDDHYSGSENETTEISTELNALNAENKYFNRVSIAQFYKNNLEMEPECIGLKNICSAKFLEIIDASLQNNDLKNVILSENMIILFDKLFIELFGETSLDDAIYKQIVFTIQNICYC